MLTIYKYDLAPIQEQGVMLPEGAKILKADAQHNLPKLWALVDTSKPRKTLLVRIICTGEIIEKPLDDWQYLDTYQLNDGDFIHHVFYKWVE